MRRRGFTLIELMIALVILGIVSLAIYRVLVQQERVSVAQTEQIGLQGGVRTISSILSDELRELGTGAGGSDIINMTPTSITYRAMRVTALACRVTDTEIRILTNPVYAMRMPVAGRDSMLLFVDGDPTTPTDDRWQAVPVNNVVNGSNCGGTPAISLGTTLDTTVTPLSSINLLAPVRVFEVMQLSLMAQGGKNFLGARSVSAGQAVQPVAGPLTANGLVFSYLDSLGAVTAVPARVRNVQVTVRGTSDRIVYAGGGQAGGPRLLQDSTIASVTLRNTPHP